MQTSNDIWHFIFQDQIESNKVIDEETLPKLQGITVFNNKYELNQKALYFLDSAIRFDNIDGVEMPIMSLTLKTLMYPLEFERFIETFCFYEIKERFPVVVKKGEIISKNLEDLKK